MFMYAVIIGDMPSVALRIFLASCALLLAFRGCAMSVGIPENAARMMVSFVSDRSHIPHLLAIKVNVATAVL